MAGSLRHYREQAALTQEELADRAGVSRTTIAWLEGGRREPRPRTLRALARALKIKPAALLRPVATN